MMVITPLYEQKGKEGVQNLDLLFLHAKIRLQSTNTRMITQLRDIHLVR